MRVEPAHLLTPEVHSPQPWFLPIGFGQHHPAPTRKLGHMARQNVSSPREQPLTGPASQGRKAGGEQVFSA